MTIQAILFDLDGTLADTAPDLAEAANQLCRQEGVALTDYAKLRVVASSGARGLIRASMNIQPDDPRYEKLKTDFLNFYEAGIAVHSRLFDGVPALLQALQQSGIPWGIVTNKIARFTDILVPQLPLAQAGCVIAGDTTPHAKPHPAPLLEASRRLGVAPESCLYVGDDLRDIQAGHAAGMKTAAAEWGYCDTDDISSWNADVICKVPSDSLRLL